MGAHAGGGSGRGGGVLRIAWGVLDPPPFKMVRGAF